MKDLMNEIKLVLAVAPVVVSNNTPPTEIEVDRQGFESLTFGVLLGTLADTDATFAATMTETDTTGSNYTAVAADDILYGSETTWDYSADLACKKIGYIGNKRFVKLTITPTNNSGNAPIGAVAILGHATHNPAGATQTP